MYIPPHLDLERAITGTTTGINEGYTFIQTESTIEISFPLLEDCVASNINKIIDTATQGIWIGQKDKDPIICGIMWGHAYLEKETQLTNSIKYIFRKNNETWPLFISSPSPQGIDPKSEFMLGVYEDSRTSPEKAILHYQEAARRGFLHAKILLADNYLSQINLYNLPRDPLAASNIYLEVFDSPKIGKLRTTLFAVKVAQLLNSLNREEDYFSFLQKNRDIPEIQFKLAQFLSPLTSKNHHQNAEEAVRELQILADHKYLDAIQLLADHYESGCGIERNLQKSAELRATLYSLDPSRKIEKEEHGFAKNILLSSLLLIATGTATFLFLKRKRH